MSGAWKYPPCKQRKTTEHKVLDDIIAAIMIIFFVIALIALTSCASKAVSQAAYDAVHFQSCYMEGC